MTSMAITAARGRGARLLLVLAVLVGLLAMHGLAGAHHAAATPLIGHAAVPPDESVVTGATIAIEVGHLHRAVQHTAAGATAAALAVRQAPSCDDGCGGVVALCVAVLVGAALALLLAHERAPRLLRPPARRRAHGPAPPVRHVQEPDPVRELCVSRT